MKRGDFIIYLIFLFAFAIIWSLPVYAQKKIVWKMQTLWSAGELPYKILEKFCKRIPVLTDGQLEISLYPAGAIVPTFETLDAVRYNIIQVMNVWPGYFTGKEPAFAPLTDFICAYKEPWEYDTFFYYRGGIELLNELYASYNVETIGIIQWGMESMFMKYPVLKPEDFKGHKFRSPQGMTADMLKKLGAGVVVLPGEEVYSALDKGVVDGADWGTISINHRMGFDRVAKYYIYPGFRSMPVSDFTVNKEAWNKLPLNIKQILKTAVRELNLETLENCSIDDYEAMREMNATGSKTLTWKEEDIERLRKVVHEVWDEWAAKSPMSAKVIEAHKKWLREIGRIQ